MHLVVATDSSNTANLAGMGAAELNRLRPWQAQTIAAPRYLTDWFKRQNSGCKSEPFTPGPEPTQMHVGEVFQAPSLNKLGADEFVVIRIVTCRLHRSQHSSGRSLTGRR